MHSVKQWYFHIISFYELKRQIRLIQTSEYFDPSWYVDQYPDVARAGIDPALHFLRHGASEGRNPSPQFHTKWYIKNNPDVQQSNSNPLVHFLVVGKAEGRLSRPGHLRHNSVLATGKGSNQRQIHWRDKNDAVFAGEFAWITPDNLRICYLTGAVSETYECGSQNSPFRTLMPIGKSPEEALIIPIVCATPRLKTINIRLTISKGTRGTLIYSIHDSPDTPALGNDKLLLTGSEERTELLVTIDLDFRAFRVGRRCFLRIWTDDTETCLRVRGSRFEPRFYCTRQLLSAGFNIQTGLPSPHLYNNDQIYQISLFGDRRTPEIEWVADVLRSKYSDANVAVVAFKDKNFIHICKNTHLAVFVNSTTTNNSKFSLPVLMQALNLHGTCTAYMNVNQILISSYNRQVENFAKICHFYIDLGASDYTNTPWTWQSNCHPSSLLTSSLIETREFPSIRSLQNHIAPIGVLPHVVIVSTLYKKSSTIESFLKSIFRQNYIGQISVVLVDDCSPDDSATKTARLIRETECIRPNNIKIELLINDDNLGNCVARNRGITSVAGDIYIVIDCDCLINRDFVAAHVREHLLPPTDVVVGPLNLETLDQPGWEMLISLERNPRDVLKRMNMQDNLKLDGFLNCITRNVSIKRSLLDQIGLFDVDLSYSAKKGSGFGWEDVELGARIYEAGGNICFTPAAYSLHQTHPSSVSEEQKILGSAKNFNRLFEKHPDFALYARRWATDTAGKILSWADKNSVEGADLDTLNARFQTSFKELAPCLNVDGSRKRRLRIVSYRWHVPHQYELHKLDHDFTLLTGTGTSFTNTWSFDQRPLRPNVKFINYNEFDPDDYDLAILHFDENVFCPDLSNDVLPADWGDTFQWFLENVPLPKIAICHGTPPFVGQYGASSAPISEFDIHSDEVSRLRYALRKIHVVCNSYQAEQEWNFFRSKVIWHGIDPQDFPPGLNFKDVIGHGVDRHRPHYRNANMYERVLERLPGSFVVEDHQHAGAKLLARNDPRFPYANYRAWVDHLRQFKAYLNTTSRSPMPRSRTEAMMCGVIPVSLRNHDVDHFIRNGVNGFFGETADELADAICFLCRHETARAKISTNCRQTALSIFNHDRFLADWQNFIDSLEI